MLKKTMTILGAIVLIASFVTLCFAINAHYAKESAFQELVSAYQFDKTTQRFNAVQERIWVLEDMCRKTACSIEVKAEIQHLKLELEELRRQMNKKG